MKIEILGPKNIADALKKKLEKDFTGLEITIPKEYIRSESHDLFDKIHDRIKGLTGGNVFQMGKAMEDTMNIFKDIISHDLLNMIYSSPDVTGKQLLLAHLINKLRDIDTDNAVLPALFFAGYQKAKDTMNEAVITAQVMRGK